MTDPSRASRVRWVMLIGLAYLVIGVVTAELAKTATSSRGVTGWRLAAWLLSLVAFVAHVVYERLRAGATSARTARDAAAAVALGAFLLAAVGPVRAHWAGPDFWRTAVLSLVAWPIITGIPAFVAALAAASVLGRVAPRSTVA